LPGFYATSITYNSASPAVAVSDYSSPYVDAYPWSNSTGFGTKYSNPSTLPTGLGAAAEFNNAGNVIGVLHTTSPRISFYAWSSGFGTRFADPVSLPEDATTNGGIGFSPSDDAVVVANGTFTSPYVAAYPWSNSTGFGTRYSAPATLPGYLSEDVQFSPNGLYVAISSAQNGSSIYNWSSGFGTKIANATTHYTSVTQTAFNSTSSVVFMAHETPPYIAAYLWSTGFGGKFSDPAVQATGLGTAISFA
jgi:hypothetical protein